MSELDYQLALLLQHQYETDAKKKKQQNQSLDTDVHYALQLQEEFDREINIENPKNGLSYDKKKLNTSKSLVDPSWELVDPTPDIHVLFVAFNEKLFWCKLTAVTVSWSKRMTSCAGICSYQGRGGLCSITLSEPLLKLRPRKDLIETLLHEMIHAYLFVTNNNRDRDGHGPEFHKHMYRINKETGTNITVYHNFHDEVRLYQQHVWRCNGPCQKRKPYFGIVRRATNRAPGPNDRWWGEHSRNCGGDFVKIGSPEKPQKEKTSTKQTVKKPKNVPDITQYFPSTSGTNKNTPKNSDTAKTVLSEISTSRINIEVPENDKSVIEKVRNHWTNKFNTTETTKRTALDNKLTTTTEPLKRPLPDNSNNGEKKVKCPVCHQLKKISDINSHLDTCLGNETQNDISNIKSESSSIVIDLSEESETCDTCNCRECVCIQEVCPACNKSIVKTSFTSHLEKCLNGFYDDLDEKYSNTDDKTDCLACGRKILKSELNSHLDSCLSMSNIFDTSNVPVEGEETGQNKINCPVCMVLINEDDMNGHVELCLKSNLKSDESDPKAAFFNSFLETEVFD